MDRYQPPTSAAGVPGREPSIVRAASVRSSIRWTAVVTEAPIDAACAAKACSFWRLTWARQRSAVVPASATNPTSSSQAIQVLFELIALLRTHPCDRTRNQGLDRSAVQRCEA